MKLYKRGTYHRDFTSMYLIAFWALMEFKFHSDQIVICCCGQNENVHVSNTFFSGLSVI